jgi:transposase
VETFSSAADIVSWAGICPGNNKTAGKRKSGTTRDGNPWLRGALCEAAWAASKTKGTYLQAQFRRLAALRGPKRALVAVASSILTAGYYMLQRGTTYQDLGPDYFGKRNIARATNRLVKRLGALGHRVILEPLCNRDALQATG